MRIIYFIFGILATTLLVKCNSDKVILTGMILEGTWDVVTHVDLYYQDGTFYKDSDNGFKIELLPGGGGHIIRTLSNNPILWVLDFDPDQFIFSEEISNGQTPIELYVNYIYDVTSLSSKNVEMFRQDMYTENGTEFMRKTYWALTKI